MPQFLKKIRRETIFTIIGSLFAIIIVTVVVSAINFLATEVKISLEEAGAGRQDVIKFNLEGLKTLGVIKENKEEPIQTFGATEAGTTTGNIATTTQSATTSNTKR